MFIKKWIINNKQDDIEKLSKEINQSKLISSVLLSRGINSKKKYNDFLSDKTIFNSPFNMVDMDKAVNTVKWAIDNNKKICIYGDYDADGITSTALLLKYFDDKCNVTYYIPNRISEGYGLNKNAIKKIADMGVELIITVDNGIVAFDEAEYIYELGMKLLITDHHRLRNDGSVPKAEAVINPHRPENKLDFREYCGVAVAFKLVCALNPKNLKSIYNQFIELVTIGTIGDVMPLQEENRYYVKKGLIKINTSPSLPIECLKKYLEKNSFTSTDIAFQICPKINAYGRIDDASKVVEFLVSEDESFCTDFCFKMEQMNNKRKEIEAFIYNDVETQLSENPKLLNGNVIVVAGHDYDIGIVGIVASRIQEKYGKPTFILNITDELARGSARSIEGIDIFDALNNCKELLLHYGGHPLAAGITLKTTDIKSFRNAINKYVTFKYHNIPIQTMNIDAELLNSDLTLETVEAISCFEPFGMGNCEPYFLLKGYTLKNMSPMGDENKHLKIEIEKEYNIFKAVRFSYSIFDFPFNIGDEIDLVVKLSKNTFKNKDYLSIQIVDFRLSNINQDKYFKEKEIYDLWRNENVYDDSLLPIRDDFVLIYKYLKNNYGYRYTINDLYFELQSKITYGKLVHCIKSFYQAGLLNFENGITMNNNSFNVDLSTTNIMKKLNYAKNKGNY